MRAFGRIATTVDRGVVVSASQHALVIRTSGGQSLSFRVTARTKIRFLGLPVRPAVLRLGRVVEVAHTKAGEAIRVARPRAAGALRSTPVAGTILLVEDEEDIAALVRALPGSATASASSGPARGVDGLLALEQHEVRLVILDLQLPDADGLDLCRAIREQSRVPIVILTARDEEIDRITGLELGADDYVAKPFSPRELTARIRAVLRRTEPGSIGDLATLGEIAVDRAARAVTVADDSVELTAKEFDLLAYFVDHAGIVLSRERLLDRVWGLTFPGGTRTVDVHVAQLRRKLGRPELIRTVRGAGYKAVAR